MPTRADDFPPVTARHAAPCAARAQRAAARRRRLRRRRRLGLRRRLRLGLRRLGCVKAFEGVGSIGRRRDELEDDVLARPRVVVEQPAAAERRQRVGAAPVVELTAGDEGARLVGARAGGERRRFALEDLVAPRQPVDGGDELAGAVGGRAAEGEEEGRTLARTRRPPVDRRLIRRLEQVPDAAGAPGVLEDVTLRPGSERLQRRRAAHRRRRHAGGGRVGDGRVLRERVEGEEAVLVGGPPVVQEE